jgi:hypothetical protein
MVSLVTEYTDLMVSLVTEYTDFMVSLVTEYTDFAKSALLRGNHTNMRAGETYVYDFIRVGRCIRYG